jgi:carboxyl-terminal processing protease
MDLRGNAGGSLVSATATRDRFLRSEAELGFIRYSDGMGCLSSPTPLVAAPSESGRRWTGRLVVLTDPLTCAASEDFLLGLQGLDHVKVIGAATAGASGRPRSVKLLPGWELTVSTALTYDRAGHCVEGSGIPVDVEADPYPTGGGDPALRAAARL